MAPETQSPTIQRFGVFEVDLRAGEVRKRGKRLKLQEQPFQVLRILLLRSGEVVTREELRNQLWQSDTFVDFDNGLNTSINKLREALGDSADNPRFIETLPRRGYRFIAPVKPMDWTGDSKSVIFFSSRDGKDGLYKQHQDEDTAQLIAPLPGDFHGARVTPDNKWVVYSSDPKDAGPSELSQLMRVPITGGKPELIFRTPHLGLPLCASAPSTLCAVAETVICDTFE